MLQGRGVPRSLAILTILFGTGMLLAGFMQGLAYSYSEGLVVATEFSGSITEDTTWTVANSPYVLTGDVVVSQGVTLTIQPGVIVSAHTGVELAVEGRLEAIGLPSNPITFTADAMSWIGIRFGVTEDVAIWQGNGRLEHVTISDAVDGIIIFSTEPTELVELVNSTIQDSSDHAIEIVLEALPQLTMSNVTFKDNATNRVWIFLGYDNRLPDDLTLTAQPGLESYEFPICADPCHLIIPATRTLTVEPGVTLLFGKGLDVEGRLEAVGLSTNPITFTGEAGWDGVSFGITSNDWHGKGNGRLEHVTISDAVDGIIIFSTEPTEQVELVNSTIQDSSDHAIEIVLEALPQLTMSNVTFKNNATNRVWIFPGYDNRLPDDLTLTAQPGLESYELPACDYGCAVIIPITRTLTIDPGVTLLLGDGLTVEGRLEAIGLPTNPITFTGDSSWGGLLFRGGDADELNGRLQHAIIQNATSGVQVDVGDNLVQGSVVLDQVTIDANEIGIEVNGGVVTATCTTVTANGRGILINNSGMPTVSIHQSNISGNSVAGFENNHATQLDGRSNWWGDASGPSGIGPGSGDVVLGNVLVAPWLDEFDCTAVYSTFLPFVIRP